jgi:AraC-like DNA-binding protein
MAASCIPLLVLGRKGAPGERLLARALPETPLQTCQSVDEAWHLVITSRVSVFACHTHDAAGLGTESLIAKVLDEFPDVTTIGVASRVSTDASVLLRFVRTGIHALLFSDGHLPLLIARRTITGAIVRCANRSTWRRLSSAVPSRARALVAYGLHSAHQPLSVDDAAYALGVTRKTLAQRCAHARTPAPQQLLGWCRLLAVAALLEDPDRPVEQIARDLGFPDGAALRNQLRRYTGHTPGSLRHAGATTETLRQFRQVLKAP